jgi:hypothetical protein
LLTENAQYQQAMASVGSVLLEYDSDKMIPAYGYGAKINGTTSHCFPLNFNTSNPEVNALAFCSCRVQR